MVIKMEKLKEYTFVYLLGAVMYGLIEVAFRGFTHWTMALTGGLAFLLIYIINIKSKTRSLLMRCLAGCVIITTLEFIVGCIVNKKFGMNVWDYSNQPGNLLGQICPLFSAIWFLISFPAMLLSFFIKGKLFSETSKNN